MTMPRTEKMILGTGALIVAIGSMLLASPDAHASPQDDVTHDAALFCRQLDKDSSPAGVVNIVGTMEAQHVPEPTMKQIIELALNTMCPEYKGAFAAAVSAAQHAGLHAA